MDIIFSVVVCVLAQHSVSAHNSWVVVETQLGSVRGIQTANNQLYRGVPYALPPVGDLRWRPPRPVWSWKPQTLDATSDVTTGCPQVHCHVFMSDFDCPRNTSEDCLKLNIYAPAYASYLNKASNSSLLPVMFFIHGGSYMWCSGSASLFDGSVLAERGDVIVVTFNYRLGVMGFLVTGTSPSTDATGNYGLQDQRLALRWVNQNIRSFGGDPDKVTVFGQSCGAQSILNHMASEESSRYFRSGIIQSGAVGVALRSFEEQYNISKLFAKNLGCAVSDLKCMRNYSAQRVVEAAFSCSFDVSSMELNQIASFHLLHPFGPYVDGNEVKGQFVDVMTSGDFSPKPLIVGSTRDETLKDVELVFKKRMNLWLYLAALGSMRPSKLLELAVTYPPLGVKTDHREAFSTADTDHMFTCPARNITFAVAGQGRKREARGQTFHTQGHHSRLEYNKGQSDVWLYVWDKNTAIPGWLEDCPTNRACHETELPYVFATAYKKNVTFPRDDLYLSDMIIEYWANFAWGGDPNIPRPDSQPIGGRGGKMPSSKPVKLLHWPKVTSRSGYHTLFFQAPLSHVIKNYRQPQCDFWDSIGYYQSHTSKDKE